MPLLGTRIAICTIRAYYLDESFEWDPKKAEAYYRKHGVRFAESIAVFADDYAITIRDEESDEDEQRFISMGVGAKGRVLVVAYSYRGTAIRILSARAAEPRERSQYEETR